MRSIQAAATTHFLIFDRGDEFIESLMAFAKAHSIRGAHFAGLGAFETSTISWWNWDTKQYEKHEIAEQVEVLSIIGELTMFEGDVRVHAHVTLGLRDLSVIGGHLFRGLVRPTLEVHLTDYGVTLERAIDPASQLPLVISGNE